MTMHEIRQQQRLRSDEDRQVHEAIAEARRARLERERHHRWWSRLLLAIAVILAIALTVGVILVGGAAVTVGRGQ